MPALASDDDSFLPDVPVELGNNDTAIFEPHMKLYRWNGEASLSVWLPTEETGYIEETESAISWKGNDKEVSIYELEANTEATGYDGQGNTVTYIQNELGGVEFDVTLKEKPESNKIVLNMDSQGLKFYYQPPLDPEHPTWADLDEDGIADAFCPENVVGSWAVYHESKRDNEYMTGKAFHIYRPQPVDAAGNTCWADIDIDPERGTITVTIPQDFLDNAIYSINHATGLTIGKQTAGSMNGMLAAHYWDDGDRYIIWRPGTGA
jgi:hypothetical protein